MRRVSRRYAVTLVAAFGLLPLAMDSYGREKEAASRWVAGTYSSFTYNEEGDDLLGVEIRLIPTRKGFVAVVQFAEGGPGDVALVDAVVAGSRVSFRLSSPFDTEGEFDGVVSAKGLDGTFKYEGGASEHVVLARGRSYWDKRG